MSNNKEKISFNDFCYRYCDGLYTPNLSDDEQSTGYLKLKYMVLNNIEPATEEETLRWENNPTKEELFEKPNIKYLRFLHPNLRSYIIDNWNLIKTLEI